MKLNVIKQSENPLLKRKEYDLELEFDSTTPSRADLKAQVATLAKSKPELVSIKHIYSAFGAKKAEAIAFVYHDLESLKMLDLRERKVYLKQEAEAAKAAAEAKKAAEEAKEAAQAATPSA